VDFVEALGGGVKEVCGEDPEDGEGEEGGAEGHEAAVRAGAGEKEDGDGDDEGADPPEPVGFEEGLRQEGGGAEGGEKIGRWAEGVLADNMGDDSRVKRHGWVKGHRASQGRV